jgi:2-keto-4-pentenoate hydratase/2-oxohepta-3-ene-1,7-dioic acid hydratase in catechol pathway
VIYCTFEMKGLERVGIVSEDKKMVVPLDEVLGQGSSNMLEFIMNFKKEYVKVLGCALRESKGIPISEVRLLAPIPNPLRGVICLGKNYKDHVNEVKSLVNPIGDIPENPIYFEKMVDRCPGDGDYIPSHIEETEFLDYEVELAVIIGKEGKNIPVDKVEEYIFGYTILNDISARDIQKKHIQWYRGKSLDGTCPMGPWLVHRDEIEFPPKLKLQTIVNKELRQSGNTEELIFDIPYIISDFSKGITLKPGDIISTGTPAGVGMGFNPPKTLKAGDEVSCYIEKIGSLTNIIK